MKQNKTKAFWNERKVIRVYYQNVFINTKDVNEIISEKKKQKKQNRNFISKDKL